MTEKELKKTKQQFTLSAEEDNFKKKKFHDPHRSQEYEAAQNQFNLPSKRVKTIEEIDDLLNPTENNK